MSIYKNICLNLEYFLAGSLPPHVFDLLSFPEPQPVAADGPFLITKQIWIILHTFKTFWWYHWLQVLKHFLFIPIRNHLHLKHMKTQKPGTAVNTLRFRSCSFPANTLITLKTEYILWSAKLWEQNEISWIFWTENTLKLYTANSNS